MYNPLIHHRRSIRLQGHSYAQPGEYYVTLCVKNRAHVLGEICLDQIILSRMGEIVKECWEAIPKHFPSARLDEYCIMPDHMHGIVALVESVRTRHAVSQRYDTLERFSHPVAGSLSTIIRSFKSAASKQIHSEGDTSFAWQSGFYEHVITGTRDLDRIRKYIMNNPCRWANAGNLPGDIYP